MRSSITPTLAICIIAGVAAGIGLARPAATIQATTAVAGVVTEVADPTAMDPNYGSDGAVAAPGAAPAPQAPAPVAAALTISDFAFGPSPAVAAGSPVTVTNADGVAHTLTSADRAFDTGEIGGGATTQLTAPAGPGSYAFFCSIHPSMTGVLDVTA